MYYFLYILLLHSFGISTTQNDDNIITIEKKIKIHHFKHEKVISYKIDTCLFYFDAHYFMSEVGINEVKHKYHEPVLKDLTLLLGQKDTVDLSSYKSTAVVASLVNDGLEKGFVEILFSGKKYLGKTIVNIEYWDKDVYGSDHKTSALYRPDSDVYTLEEGDIFYYYMPSVKRITDQRFRD
ncbi:MAG TPA: hypothetical protein VNW06_04480 [Cytophagaceae bacterium]|jgi:hypothetical protein|nr:hypothetical protein [Cytophagaceae bacterium]